MANPTSREELYKRIKEGSKTEVILEEMQRLGFWPKDQGIPQGPEAEVQRLVQMNREISALQSELSRLHNREAMLKALRQKHMLEAKQRRAETKKKHEAQRLLKAEAWKEAKKHDIHYLGEKVSYGLRNKTSDHQRLTSFQLQPIDTAEQLALAIKIEVGELRFLSFTRAVSQHSHYKRFDIPKKNGGLRHISAPMPRLKEVQNWVLQNILEKIPVHPAAHGFLKGRSIVSNARPHVGQEVVLNLDLRDFFPSIQYPRVKGMFRSFGYSEQVATILALVCTEPAVDRVELDQQVYYVQRGPRFVPQGAPSSPQITNILCRRLDKRLAQLALTLGFTYTRYADDLSFSCSVEGKKNLGKLLSKTRSIVRHEGFTVHPDKTRVLHKGRQQEVTGLVVNQELAVNRKTLRRLRAALYQIEKDGVTGKHWGQCPDVISSIKGYAQFVYMVNPQKGTALLQRIRGIKERLRYQPPIYKRYPKGVPAWIAKKEREKQAATISTHAPTTTNNTAPTTTKTAPHPTPPRSPHTEAQKPWWKFW